MGYIFVLIDIIGLIISSLFGVNLRDNRLLQLLCLCLLAVAVILYAISLYKNKSDVKTLQYALIAHAVVFIYYSIIPQYYYKDNEGYFAGAVVLTGYISLSVLCTIYKRSISDKDKHYIFSIINVIALMACIYELMFYKSRVYVLSLIVYVFIPVAFLVFRQMFIKLKKSVNISYFTVLCASGILSIATTVLRGTYLIKMPALAVMLILCILLFNELKSDKSISPFFPYEFALWKEELKKSFKSRFVISALIVLSIVIQILILGPLEIYAANMLSFSFGYTTFLPLFLIIGTASCIASACFISLFTKKTFKLICIALTSLSVLSYLQYILMNTKLMEEDGARLRLNTMGYYPAINLIVWIVLIIAIFIVLYKIKDNWVKIAAGACVFLSIIQFAAVAALVIKCINSPAPRYYQLTGEKQFSVAKDENVIVLVPDTFARVYMDMLVEDDPAYMDIFKDFVYYDNLNCEYFPTFPSLTHILTDYDCEGRLSSGLSDERVKWQSDAWHNEKCVSFYKDIHDAGYNFYMNIIDPCELVGAYEDVLGKIDNVEYAESNVDKKRMLKMLSSMSVFRSVPYVFKPPFEYFSWDFWELETYSGVKGAYKNEDFYARACEGITVDESVSKKVHVINWHGFHDGYSNDEFCNPVPPEEIGNVSELQNCKAVMLCIDTYLQKLKEIGRYDDSAIIIMGDHGFSKYLDGCVFIKLPGQQLDSVRINHEAGTYSQWQPTIIDILGLDHSAYGKSWLE